MDREKPADGVDSGDICTVRNEGQFCLMIAVQERIKNKTGQRLYKAETDKVIITVNIWSLRATKYRY